MFTYNILFNWKHNIQGSGWRGHKDQIFQELLYLIKYTSIATFIPQTIPAELFRKLSFPLLVVYVKVIMIII